MNLSTRADFWTSRPYSDESGFGTGYDTFASVLLRVTGTFGGGLALTAILAVLAHH